MIGWIRLVLVLAVVLVVSAVLVPLQLIAMRTGWFGENRARGLWHRLNCWALGFRVHVVGELSPKRPLLIAANHVSWTDIEAMASRHDITFVAKSELASWPLLGPISRMQRPIYVERDKKRKAGEQAGEVARRLASSQPVVLFAEGTTSDGNLVLPFKSSLFGAAAMALGNGGAKEVFIQPVAIAYTRVHGLPMGRLHRPIAAWMGDETFLPLLVRLLREGAVDVELRFGEPVPFTAASSRKTVAREMEHAVRALLVEALKNPRPHA